MNICDMLLFSKIQKKKIKEGKIIFNLVSLWSAFLLIYIRRDCELSVLWHQWKHEIHHTFWQKRATRNRADYHNACIFKLTTWMKKNLKWKKYIDQFVGSRRGSRSQSNKMSIGEAPNMQHFDKPRKLKEWRCFSCEAAATHVWCNAITLVECLVCRLSMCTIEEPHMFPKASGNTDGEFITQGDFKGGQTSKAS